MNNLRALVLAILQAIVWMSVLSAGRLEGSSPRLACYYLDSIPVYQNDLMAPQLARYDLIILDMEMGEVNPDLLSSIRMLNPEIKILAYMTSEEVTTDTPSPSTYPLRYLLINSIQSSWWLRTSTGDHASFWPGTRMLNCSIQCPVVNGETWAQHFAGFISDHVLSNPLWDGFFVDNCWSVVPWDLEDVDSNNDGLNDTVSEGREWLDAQWKAGMNVMLQNLMTENPSKILIGNAGYDYGEYLHGAMVEGVVENPLGFYDEWQPLMQRMARLEAEFRQPQYNIINAALPGGMNSNFPYFRFSLATSLLSSVYFGIDLGQYDHSDTWWFDEYNSELGQAVSGYEDSYLPLGTNMLINGDFSNGINGWTGDFINGTTGSVGVDHEAGNAYAKCQVSSTNGVYYTAQLMQTNNPNLDFTDDNDYLLSFRAKADHPMQISFMIQKHTQEWDWVMPALLTISLTNSWQEYSYCVKSTNSAFQAQQLRASFNLGLEAGIVSLDDISLIHVQLQAASREYENGIVLCNPGNQSVQVNLGRTFYRISGTQDPEVNNGSACTDLSLAPMDGIILLNSPTSSYQDELPVPSPDLDIYPNPSFNHCKMTLRLPQSSQVQLYIYNIRGQLVKEILDGYQAAGRYDYELGTELNLLSMPAGIYFVKLQTQDSVRAVRKIVLLH